MVVLLYIYLTIHYSAGSNHQTNHLSKTKPNIYKSISSTKEEHLQADIHSTSALQANQYQKTYHYY